MKKSLSALALFSALVLGLMACSTPPPANQGPGQPYTTEEYKPGVPGTVQTIQLTDGSSFDAVIKDGLVVFEGDIVLGTVDEVTGLAQAGIAPLSNSCDYDRWWCDKWPNKVVYFEIVDEGEVYPGDPTLRSVVLGAIGEIERRTNLDFVYATSGPRIRYHKAPEDDGCYTERIGHNQDGSSRSIAEVWLEAWGPDRFGCYSRGTAVHETMHALGFYHEQTRDDRSDYVRILWDNIRSGKSHNFENPDGWILNFNVDIGRYDFDSVMHYSCTAFAKRDGLNTLEPKVAGVTCENNGKGRPIGQRSGMSDGDVLGVLTVYRPSLAVSAPSAKPRNTPLTFELNGEYPRETNAVKPYTRWYVDGAEVASAATTGSLSTWEYATGPHTLEAVVEINGVELDRLSHTFTLSNVDPVVEITQPLGSGPYCQNETITLRALASDVDTAPYFESGNVSDRVDWIYDPDPNDTYLGWTFANNTPSASYTLSSTGTVRFIARVDDADGATASDYVDVVVDPCTNTPPTVTITNPSGDLNVWVDGNDANGWYYSITLQGTASDAEDGPLTGSWYTNRGDVQPGGPASGEQLLGNGNTLPVKLYAKAGAAVTEHVISFRVTDSDGNTRTVTVTITVNQLI
ncbi:M12 family metallopeptidase [Oceanithermus sp.]|uniref:M12 family metallopeptidase n=1 Tax=Oceanithermus sp. TaxID=2268145 RepID=UPI00257E7275|nr:M12 family metallopeptidase [Oceanithermus sp.]